MHNTLIVIHNYSVWLDTREVSSWDRKEAEFTSVRFLNREQMSFSGKEILRIIFFICVLTPTGVLIS